MKGLRVAGGLIIILTLAGCAGQGLSLSSLEGDTTATPPPKQVNMAGRWRLTEPGAPSCGLHFGGGPGIRDGAIQPEGGCPGGFFTARHFELSKDGQRLNIDDYQMNLLAHMSLKNGVFRGTSNAGKTVTLSRYPTSKTGVAPSPAG